MVQNGKLLFLFENADTAVGSTSATIAKEILVDIDC
jgi:hypothetical protein